MEMNGNYFILNLVFLSYERAFQAKVTVLKMVKMVPISSTVIFVVKEN